MNESHEVYVDNSMTVQKRQVLSYEDAVRLNLTIPDESHVSVEGLNGYPIVDGVLMRSGG